MDSKITLVEPPLHPMPGTYPMARYMAAPGAFLIAAGYGDASFALALAAGAR